MSDEDDIVSYEDVQLDKYYVVRNCVKRIGIITATNYTVDCNKPNFCLVALDRFTCNNCFERNLSLKTLIKNRLDIGNEVFEFDTFKEMAQWIVENSWEWGNMTKEPTVLDYIIRILLLCGIVGSIIIIYGLIKLIWALRMFI